MNVRNPTPVEICISRQMVAAGFVQAAAEKRLSIWSVVELELYGFMDGYRGKPWRRRRGRDRQHQHRDMYDAGVLARWMESTR